MTAPIEGGKLLALPYRGPAIPPECHTLLLDHLSAHPLWFASGLDAEKARLLAMQMLVSGDYGKWEIWSGGRFAGMILLSRLVENVDALFHFTLLPASLTGVTLFSARRLFWNFLGQAFEDFNLQRISVEVPEHAPKLAHFLRQRLAFRYEGETDLDRLQKNKGIVKFDIPGAPTWIAGQGSRREHAHWNGKSWSDLILLRLLRSEYLTRASSGGLPKATSEHPNTGSPECRSDQSPLSSPSLTHKT